MKDAPPHTGSGGHPDRGPSGGGESSSPGSAPREARAATEPKTIIGPAVVFRWCAAGATAVLMVFVAAAMVYTVRTLLVQAVIAVFISVSLDPLVRWMISRGLKRPQAVAIIFFVVVLVVAGLVWAAAPTLAQQAGALTTDFPGYLGQLRQRSPGLAGLEARFNLQPKVDAWVTALPGRIGGQAIGYVRQFLGAAVSILLVVVLTIYLMLDLTRLRRGLVRLFPVRHRPQVTEVISVAIDKVGRYMIGNLVISVIAGFTAFVALTALGVPFALPLALIVAVTDLIPLAGATIGAVICLTVAAATSDLWPTTVLVGLFFVVYQQLENYVIAPRVIRGSVDISSVAVLFAALVGASMLGVVGAVMAIPIAATVKVIVSSRLRGRDEPGDEQSTAPATPAMTLKK